METLNGLNGITCTRISEADVQCNGTEYTTESKYLPGEMWFWIYLSVFIALTILAGIFSGLTLGLLSLDTTTLEVLQRAGTPTEKKNAKKVMPLIERHHLLLVTLISADTVAVVCMPLFMDKISNELIAIVVSVTAVLLFGDVFPQALCSRYGLSIGAALVPLVWALIGIFFIIAWPLAKLLDCLLGKNNAIFYRRSEIKAIVDIHGPGSANLKLGEEEQLTYDEVLIIKGALDMKNQTGKDAMIPLSSVFMLDINSVLDAVTMKKITTASHSRIPVYEGTRKNIVSLLLVKKIIILDPKNKTPIRDLVKHCSYCRTILTKPETTPLYDLLNEFQKDKCHLCFLTRAVDSNVHFVLEGGAVEQEIVGIITLEDVIKELLREETIDETKVVTEMQRRVSIAKARKNSYFAAQRQWRPSVLGNVHLEPTLESDEETTALLPKKA